VIVGERDQLDAREADERFRQAFETFQKLIARVEDVAERSRLEEVLWELALVDDLTGLHNRRSFMLLAEQALKEAARAKRPMIMRFLDLDGLKAINHTHGHAAGDRALRLIAGALRAACRDSDIIGRLSGDEFAIALAEAHELDGLEGRVRTRVAQAAELTDYPLSVSIGVAQCPPGELCTLAELFERADQAMYAEKAAKRRPPADEQRTVS
jgi:diguanylate cyclase (GGDEF)-like protein